MFQLCSCVVVNLSVDVDVNSVPMSGTAGPSSTACKLLHAVWLGEDSSPIRN